MIANNVFHGHQLRCMLWRCRVNQLGRWSMCLPYAGYRNSPPIAVFRRLGAATAKPALALRFSCRNRKWHQWLGGLQSHKLTPTAGSNLCSRHRRLPVLLPLLSARCSCAAAGWPRRYMTNAWDQRPGSILNLNTKRSASASVIRGCGRWQMYRVFKKAAP